MCTALVEILGFLFLAVNQMVYELFFILNRDKFSVKLLFYCSNDVLGPIPVIVGAFYILY